jgi:hypothetical protein
MLLRNFVLSCLIGLFLALCLPAVVLAEEEYEFRPEYGLYFEWIYSRLGEDTEDYGYIWGYGQRFGATVLAIQGEMFKPADTCVKYEGEVRECSPADLVLISRSFAFFQSGEIVALPEWVFNTEY